MTSIKTSIRSPSFAVRIVHWVIRNWLVWAVALGVSAVIGLALHEEQREFEAALATLTRQQQILALLLSDELSARLSAVHRDALLVAEDVAEGRGPSLGMRNVYPRIQVLSEAQAASSATQARMLTVRTASTEGRAIALTVPIAWLVSPSARIESPDEFVVLVKPPGDSSWQTVDGRQVAGEALSRAVANGHDTVRLERDQAVAFGLPARRAVAAVAIADVASLGSWVTAVVASASNERDRWDRARGRIFLGVLVPCGLIIAFGFVALRRQRRELALEKQLAVAALVQESDARLARASRAATTGTLAMGIAHEISTPLGIIVGRAEQLEARVGSDPKAIRAVRAIAEQATQINQVVRGFLDLARGNFPALRPIDPANVIRGARRLVEHRFVAARVDLEVHLNEPLPALAGDLRLLEHAIVNLLLNACEASAMGATVDVWVHAENSLVDFIVEDRGVGIGHENIAHATEPFFTTKPEGSGLGLAIANEIVNIHRGTLVIEPREGGGTRVRIRLPACEKKDADE
jgi:two-component system NtrC family sensor kinase